LNKATTPHVMMRHAFCAAPAGSMGTSLAVPSPRAYWSLSIRSSNPIFVKELLKYPHEAEWTPFQTDYFSENLVLPGIEPGYLDLYPGTLTTRPQRRSLYEMKLAVYRLTGPTTRCLHLG
jgi:hypothetical protein